MKILIGGLAKDATLDQFTKYFGKYGEITDSVIMKDRSTGRPKGFGFITYYADPSVVDTVIAETHIINDKQVEHDIMITCLQTLFPNPQRGRCIYFHTEHTQAMALGSSGISVLGLLQ